MKNLKRFGIYALMAGALVACSDDDTTDDGGGDGTGTTPDPISCRLMSIDKTDGSDAELVSFMYDTSNELVSVEYSSNDTIWKKDSLIYSGGMLSELHEISIDPWDNSQMVDRVYTYAYTGSDISSATETGTDNGTAYTKTYTYTYSGSNISGITAAGDPNGDNQSFTVVSWIGNNMDTVLMDADGSGQMVIALKATFDDKPNYFDHLPLKPDDVIEAMNENNMMTVALAEEADFGGGPMPAGTLIMDRSYTYGAEDQVATMTEAPNAFDPNAAEEVSTFTFICE